MCAFSLASRRGGEGVSCDADGVFVGGVPLLRPPSAEKRCWTARPAAEINEELTARYRLPIDIASRAGALALIATALNRGDLAMAAIAAVQMQLPDPPPLAKRAENPDEIARRTRDSIAAVSSNFFGIPLSIPAPAYRQIRAGSRQSAMPRDLAILFRSRCSAILGVRHGTQTRPL
jgi:hypothetical protein